MKNNNKKLNGWNLNHIKIYILKKTKRQTDTLIAWAANRNYNCKHIC